MISLAQFKIFLKIDAWDTSKDDQLNQAINLMKGFVASYVWYSLELNASMLGEFRCSSNEFHLARRPVNGVSKIEYFDDEYDPTKTEYTITGNTNLLLEKGIVRTRDVIWKFVTITYSFGWDENTAPESLQAACMEIAAAYYKKMGEISMNDLNSESVDGDQISFKWVAGSISQDSLTVLDNYKDYGFSA